jgi:amino acid adenylation domain-containing protein
VLLRAGDEDHVLLLTMHHVVSDGWSLDVLWRELSALYAAYARGEEPTLPELPVQYADYAVWQREHLSGERLERHLAYWRAQLAGAPAVLEMPIDRPRAPGTGAAGAACRLELDEKLTEALRALSRREGATLYMTLLAAFQVLLGRYGGGDDVVVGSPIAGRTRAETEGLIGLFVNTLALRTDLSGDPSFRELLGRVRERVLGAYEHQELPFEKLVDELEVERSLFHMPLVQVMFAFQAAGRGIPVLDGVRVEPFEAGERSREVGVSHFDLGLDVVDSDGLTAFLSYRAALFDAATAGRMLSGWAELLRSAATAPDRPFSELSVLPPGEAERITREWNPAAVHMPDHDRPVHALIERWGERTAGRVAVVSGDARITYGELCARARRLARRLRAHGVGPEVRVGIYAEKSVEMMVGILAVLKAGGAYVPLDPSYPADRVAYMLEDASVSVLLTQAMLADVLPPARAKVLFLDPMAGAEDGAEEDGHDAAAPENLAYVVYTSGTTGRPKGVQITHRSLVSQYLAWEDAYGLRERATTHLQMAAFSFDVFSGDLARALCSGGTLVLCPREVLLDPAALYALMRREGVDTAEFVPAVLRSLLDHLDEAGGSLDFMRLVIAGSDSWYADEYRDLLRRIGTGTRCVNSYGVAECTIDSTYFEARALEGGKEVLVPIGRPFANSETYIVDRHLRPVPVGVPGELYLSGAGLGRGYLNQPALTARKFVPHPFGLTPGARLYRTEDRARYLADGNIEFLGRADNQIKIRGLRIEPGEVEAVLQQHPEVHQAVVRAWDEAPGRRRLVAYLVESPSGEVRRDELRAFLREQLPEYMVPSIFVGVDALPLTPAGKVDRAALTPPAAADAAVPWTEPRTPVEAAVADVWSEVLGAGRVGADDDFFAMGGHSLLAIRVASRLGTIFPAEFPLRAVFECPTVEGMARTVCELCGAETADEIARMYVEFSRLSEEEVALLLADDAGERP